MIKLLEKMPSSVALITGENVENDSFNAKYFLCTVIHAN